MDDGTPIAVRRPPMATAKQRFLALLATGRVANLPTIVTHVGVGMMLSLLSDWGLFVHSDLQALSFANFILVEFLIIAFLGCVFYLGGCFLGDGTDAPFDIEHRPERPIPRGIIPMKSTPLLLLSSLLPLCGLSGLQADEAAKWYRGNTHTHTLWSDPRTALYLPKL